MKKTHTIVIICFISITAVAISYGSVNAKGEWRQENINTLLDPRYWLGAIQNSITIPSLENWMTPEKALGTISPKLQEINKGVKETAGIDLAKFIGWVAHIIQVVFQTIVNFLKTTAGSLQS